MQATAQNSAGGNHVGNVQRRLNLEIQHRRSEADGVVSLVLADPDGADLPPWEPGAHVDLCLPGFARQYSLCGAPADRSRYRIAVLREAEGRGGSKYVHDELYPGCRVDVRSPRNNFALQPAPEYLFIAGGIGITPLLPMIAATAARSVPWRLVYGGRTRPSMAFRDRLSAYGDQVQLIPQDEFGLLDLPALFAVPGRRHVYCCGPEPLLAAVERLCAEWPRGRLHVERFNAPPVTDAGPAHPFTVRCAESAVTVEVATGQSMLDAMLEAGIDLNFDCREGTCGTCELDLLDGEADHRDAVLTAEERAEGKLIFPCVSRARNARLVVDA